MMKPLIVIHVCLLLSATGSRANQCSGDEPIREFDINNEDNPSVHDDLTTSEIQEVYDYMKSRPEFNAKEADMVTMDSTYVYHIERLPPPKAQVLAYVDGAGGKPERLAWVVMYRGDLTPPVIEEYEVGPLPGVTRHKRRPIAGRDSIEYIRRHLYTVPDYASWHAVIAREVARVDHILKQVTGFTFHNCTDRCLSWLPGMPGTFRAKDRSMWVFLTRRVEGSYLHPVGLQFRIKALSSLNIDDWTVDYAWFRGKVYADLEDFAARYVRDSEPDEPENYDSRNLYSSLNHRGDPLPEKKKRGPEAFMPDGRRYSVDGHHVEWQGWSFDFNVRSLVGLQVHEVMFRAEKIAYELGLSEVGIVYSGASPTPMHSAFVDGAFNFGLETYDLIPGVDCPSYATYFDFAHFFLFKPTVHKKSVCVFEHNRGVPLRHHHESDHAGSYYYAQGMAGNILILRSAITVHNYEYILDYVFHQNGVLEVVVSLSGYILSSFYTGEPRDDSRGFKVVPDGLGQIHNHWLHFKVDIDVGQTKNRFETLDIKVESVPDPGDPGRNMYVQKFDKNLRTTEKNATYQYNFDTPKYLIFLNNDAENKYGNKKGYRLYPVNLNKQPLPENWALEKGLSYERNQVVVTRHKDNEQRGSSIYNLADLVDPVVNFLDYIEDDEPIVDEDLVAWVTMGAFHIPHSEDIPIVQTPGLSLTYFLMPYNYFDEDPSLASRDNVRVTPNGDGTDNFEYAGDPPSNQCGPRSEELKSSGTTAVCHRSIAILFLVASVFVRSMWLN